MKNNNIYNKIMQSIDNEIRISLAEQFNINNMDLNKRQKNNKNIFNKNVLDPFDIYDRIIKHEDVQDDEIKQLNDDIYISFVKVKDKSNLIRLSRFYSQIFPFDSMNWLDVSGIDDMSNLFNFKDYNGDISKWDTSNVTDMHNMFYYSKFNKDISEWNVSHVRNMSQMFKNSIFNQDISQWDVSNVEIMDEMFLNSPFNQDVSEWNVDNVIVQQSPYKRIWSIYMKDEYKPEKLRYFY